MLGLDAVSVETDVESGKVIIDERDKTTVPHIFCIGDAADVCLCLVLICLFYIFVSYMLVSYMLVSYMMVSY